AHDPGKVADCASEAVEDGSRGRWLEGLADGFAEGTHLLLSRRIMDKVAFGRGDSAKGRRLAGNEGATLHMHQLQRATTDVDDVSIAKQGAVDRAEEAGGGLFGGGQYTDGD